MPQTTHEPARTFRGETTAPRSACVFACPEGAIRFEQNAGDAAGRFEITAYDGGIAKHWYWGNFAIDLQGLTFASKRLPVLDSHFTESRIGFTTAQQVADQVTFSGQFLKNAKAQELRGDMQEGFPMQASLWPRPSVIEQVADGANVEVNGRSLKGPGAVFRKAEIMEVSMCVFGVLKNTQSTAFAAADTEQIEFTLLGKDPPMSEKDKSPLTLDQLQADYPTVFAAVQAAGRQAERDRFAALQKACGDDLALAAECFSAGLTVAEAMGKANENLSLRLRDAEAKLAATPAAVVQTPLEKARAEFKSQPAPQTAAEQAAQFDEATATDEELKAHFAANPGMRQEFSKVETYIAGVHYERDRS